jgi:LysR family transcriptional regulator, benzoate and cis,cis-muconate-responsive activator of ben and cat genes
VDLRQLRYFVAVAEELHFTRAALRLHLAQSALSAQIRALEADVGGALFVRTPRRVALTAVGEALLTDARRLLADADSALGHARGLARAGEQRLIVGCLGPASAEQLGPAIAAFRDRRPEVSAEVQAFDFGAILSCLFDARADVALVHLAYSAEDLAGLVVVPLAEQARVVALAETHPLASRSELRPSDLADQVFITRGEAPLTWRDFWMLTEQIGARPRVHRQPARGHEEWLHLVSSGQGIDTVPAYVVRRYRWPGIAYVPLVDAPPARPAMARLAAHRSPLPGEFVSVATES